MHYLINSWWDTKGILNISELEGRAVEFSKNVSQETWNLQHVKNSSSRKVG